MRQRFDVKLFSRAITPWSLLIAALMLTMLSIPSKAAEPLGSISERRSEDDRRAPGSDQKPASVLVYNYYTSSAANPAQTDTVFSMTNVSRSATANVHLFFIAGECFLADSYLCLTANQTASFLASEIDPGSSGYVIAVATDSQLGCPISFNNLIGSESVKFANGRAGSFNAEGFAALYNGRLPGCNANTTLAEVELDGKRYEAAPQTLALDKVFSLANGHSTLLIINSLNTDLVLNPATQIGPLRGLLYDDAENAFSFARTVNRCQLAEVLSDTFPMTTPAFSTVVGSGRSGWLQLTTREGKGVTGAVISFNPNAVTTKGIFNNSHNLHRLDYTTATIKVPVFPPSC